MRGPLVRMSVEGAAEVKRRAAASGRTVVAELDLALGVGAGRPELSAPAAERPVGVSGPRCPSCGCGVVMHQRGTGLNRCEAHPTCRWTP